MTTVPTKTRVRRSAALLLVALACASCSKSPAGRAAGSAPRSTTSVSAAGAATTTPGRAAPAACSGSAGGASGSNGPESSPPGDIPDNQAYVAFTPASGAYSIQLPEGWARSETADAVTFTDKFNSIRVQVVAAAAAPNPDSARARELPAIQAEAACLQAGDVTTVTRKGGTAVLIKYRADAPPDTVTGRVVRDDVERYELWHNGSEAVLTLTAPMGSDNVDPWRRITDSFVWQR
jgi:hypothetical protein